MIPIQPHRGNPYPSRDLERWDGATQPVRTETPFRSPAYQKDRFLFGRYVPTAYPALAGLASVVLGT